MSIFSSFITGLVFGLGLILSGMANPGKVVSFLDLAGNWDPSLAFVMGGAVTVAFFAFRAAGRRSRSLGESDPGCTLARNRCAADPGQRHVRNRLGGCRLLPRPGAGFTRHRASQGADLFGCNACWNAALQLS